MHAAYIHIPFCKSICTYCDFCKVYYQPTLVSKYLKALEEEILSQYNNTVFAFMSPNDISKLEQELKTLLEEK